MSILGENQELEALEGTRGKETEIEQSHAGLQMQQGSRGQDIEREQNHADTSSQEQLAAMLGSQKRKLSNRPPRSPAMPARLLKRQRMKDSTTEQEQAGLQIKVGDIVIVDVIPAKKQEAVWDFAKVIEVNNTTVNLAYLWEPKRVARAMKDPEIIKRNEYFYSNQSEEFSRSEILYVRGPEWLNIVGIFDEEEESIESYPPSDHDLDNTFDKEEKSIESHPPSDHDNNPYLSLVLNKPQTPVCYLPLLYQESP